MKDPHQMKINPETVNTVVEVIEVVEENKGLIKRIVAAVKKLFRRRK